MEVTTDDPSMARTHEWAIPDTPADIDEADTPTVVYRELTGRGKVRYDRLEARRRDLIEQARQQTPDGIIERIREEADSDLNDFDDDDIERMIETRIVMRADTPELFGEYVDFCVDHIVRLNNVTAGGKAIDWSDDEMLAEHFGDARRGRRKIVMSLGHSADQRKYSPYLLAASMAAASMLDDDEAENFEI